jgi:hypothetical protein
MSVNERVRIWGMVAVYGFLAGFPAIILPVSGESAAAFEDAALRTLVIGAVAVFGAYMYRREFLGTEKYEILFALTSLGLNIFQFLGASVLALFFFTLDSLSGGADSTEG